MRRLVVCALLACNTETASITDSTGVTGTASAPGITTSDATGGAVTSSTTSEPTGGAATWASWTRMPGHHFRGQIFDGDLSLASDPCVLRDDAGWRMYYTCVAGAAVGGLCGVRSPDGFTWTPLPSIDPAIDGLVARARPGVGWDENMETCAVHHDGTSVTLHYSGYPQLDGNGERGPASWPLYTG